MADEIKFFDLKTKKTFSTSNYKVIDKKGRRMAMTTSPSGTKSVRFLRKE